MRLFLLSLCLLTAYEAVDGYRLTKQAGFDDRNTGYTYKVSSFNLEQPSAGVKHQAYIRVSRIKAGDRAPEEVQSIPFSTPLVDFDLHCLPTHCYLVTATSRTRRNIKLYSWQRTQFDEKAVRDSFAIPQAVKLFRIQSSFFIAIAQEQLHLSPPRLLQESDEPTRFIGCAILKFIRAYEPELRYHQFIKLKYDPRFVSHIPLLVNDFNNLSSIPEINRLNENHFLAFSSEPFDWQQSVYSTPVSIFMWSPLNDYFWPSRVPRNVEVVTQPPQFKHLIIKYPVPLSQNLSNPVNVIPYLPVESCFGQLERILSERELATKRLIESSRSIWQSKNRLNQVAPDLTNVSAQVIVHGNVIVRGSLIESPRITLINPVRPVYNLTSIVDVYSPSIVENKLTQAHYKLKYMRGKLERAITASLSTLVQLSRVRFFGPIIANQVIFKGNGIVNSNVLLNGISYKQLQHELVSLRGAQDIVPQVVFRGNVTADLLEIHGIINGHYYLKDAVDITSSRVQVIDSLLPSSNPQNQPEHLDFLSVQTPAVILSHNATFNGFQLDQFVTNDNRTQFIDEGKWFKHLSMRQLDLANPNVRLNSIDIGRLATNAIHLLEPNGNKFQTIRGRQLTFSKPVFVKQLIINNLINQQMNISSLIHDTVKSNDPSLQEISGHKHFLAGLTIERLTTDGTINGVVMSRVFNLNELPPVFSHSRNLSTPAPLPINGLFKFFSNVTIVGNLNAQLLNKKDLSRLAVQRSPIPLAQQYNFTFPRQLVHGHKLFYSPLVVKNQMRLLDPPQLNQTGRPVFFPRPLINGFDLRQISENIRRQMENPSTIQIDNLVIVGNLNLNLISPQETIMGNDQQCPLNALRDKLVLKAAENQFIKSPVRVKSLRVRSAQLDPRALNGMTFPDDFVLKFPLGQPNVLHLKGNPRVELVFGHKSFEHLVVVPSSSLPSLPISGLPQQAFENVHFGHLSIINNITYKDLQTFVNHETQKSSTGETVYQTLTVYGNIQAKKINGYNWPRDILLKSLSSNQLFRNSHQRIYSPLVFLDSSYLSVDGQLVLRGPIQLEGRLNGVNLTEFAHLSATYGDKELLSVGRPLKNKIFAGGLTVTGHLISQGLIDGVNFDEMRNRVVTIERKPTDRSLVMGHKYFMSDLNFLAPLNITFLIGMPVDQYLRRINLDQVNNLVRIASKKMITGELIIDRQIIVDGLINGVNVIDLNARAISLNRNQQFNKTLTIEGHVYMDNLLIDEKDGIIDNVRLTNLLPIAASLKNELVFKAPVLYQPQNSAQGYLTVEGRVNDCQITCTLNEDQSHLYSQQIQPAQRFVNTLIQEPPLPFYLNQDYSPSLKQVVNYPPRQIQVSGQNITYMRTTPPYVTDYRSLTPRPIQAPIIRTPLVQRKAYLDQRSGHPFAIRYDVQPQPPIHTRHVLITNHINEHLDMIRRELVTFHLIKSSYSNIVVGFIDALTNDIAHLTMPHKLPDRHANQLMNLPASFLQLDQTDFPFMPTTYHLRVGVMTKATQYGENVTQILSTVGSGVGPFSTLPIKYPNSALFLKSADDSSLFLLISQDYSTLNSQNNPHCPSSLQVQSTGVSRFVNVQGNYQNFENLGGVHVYLFHALENSSLLNSAYFDLYQTINLHAIDSFKSFNYGGSTYALAVSRANQMIYLLILRGYSGFQTVVHFEAPGVDYIKIVYALDSKPMLIIYQTNGLYKVMEPVII